ncbi:MAG: CRISPR system precrRNA processing endoribonuclease RAMP protein Cas6 [Promethearchaeota archaeon]
MFRGVIMKWLNDCKPELVYELHENQKIRPYAVNYFIHKQVPKIDFALTTYKDAISKALLKDLISSDKVKISVGEKVYLISQIRFERIESAALLQSAKPIKIFNIRFATPVYFNTSLGDYPVRFPLPSLLFGNLAHIWNDINKDLAEINRDDFINWVNAHVYISYYKIKTVQRDIRKPEKVSGGLGNASFHVQKANKNYYKHVFEEMNKNDDARSLREDYLNNCRWLEALCKLGEYTNVGANRTAGLGVIRYYPKKYMKEK